MTPLLHPPLIGELWWSVLARQAEHAGPPASEPVIRHLLLAGNRRSLGSPLFPRQIEGVRRNLSVAIPADDVIKRHTLLPYYAPFLDSKSIQLARSCMIGNGHAEFALGVAQMEDYPVTLSLCPKCVAEQIEETGFAGWLCCHQPPGTLICSRHHSQNLIRTNVSARVRSQIAQFAPVASAHRVRRAHFHLSCSTDLEWLADVAASLLAASPPCPGPARLAALYRRGLLAHNLIDEFGRLRWTDLHAEFCRRFKQLFEAVGCEAPDVEERDNWIARLVRRPVFGQSPLKHLLMFRFLGHEVLPALQEAAALPPFAPAPAKPELPMRRSTRITEGKVTQCRRRWLKLCRRAGRGSIRVRHDALYCWLWRNDRAWLRSQRPRSPIAVKRQP